MGQESILPGRESILGEDVAVRRKQARFSERDIPGGACEKCFKAFYSREVGIGVCLALWSLAMVSE